MLTSWNLKHCSDPKLIKKLKSIGKKDIGANRKENSESISSPFFGNSLSDEKIPVLDFIEFLGDFQDYFSLHGNLFFEKLTEYSILANAFEPEKKD